MTAIAHLDPLVLSAATDHYRFSLGCDLLGVTRFRKVLARAPAFVDTVFTPAEVSYCRGRHDPALHLAARFAAKEAVLKALGIGLGVPPARSLLQQIEVLSNGGAPRLCLHGRMAQRAHQLGVMAASITLSHDVELAIAQVFVLSRKAACPS
jgi:holo-[acyl-carrier protein] synthase